MVFPERTMIDRFSSVELCPLEVVSEESDLGDSFIEMPEG